MQAEVIAVFIKYMYALLHDSRNKK